MINNRIFIFFSIGFALLLFGKISKVDLYHNYFKQIEDVEFRNQTDLAGILYAEWVTENSASERETPVISGLLIPFPEIRSLPLMQHCIPGSLSFIDFSLLLSGSPRAP